MRAELREAENEKENASFEKAAEVEAKLEALENEAAAMHDSSGFKEMTRKIRGGKELIHVIGGGGLDTEGEGT